MEIYRYFVDDFVIQFCIKLQKKDFTLKFEDYSWDRKGKRQYLNDEIQRDYTKRINAHFLSKVKVSRIRRGKYQEIETLINEEAMLFAMYLRGERPTWIPRMVELS